MAHESTQSHVFVKLLEPYHAALQRSVEVPQPTELPSSMMWLKTRNGCHVSPKTIAGLEILALLLLVDWDLWKRQVKSIWTSQSPTHWVDKPTQVGIEVDMIMSNDYKPTFDTLALSRQSCAQPSEVLEARAIAQSILYDQGTLLKEIPVRLTRQEMTSFDGVVAAITQLVAARKFLGNDSSRSSRSVEACLSHYEGLRLRNLRVRMGSTSLDAWELFQLESIMSDGVAIEYSGAVKMDALIVYPTVCARALWKLLAVSPVDASARDRGVKHLTLSRSFDADFLRRVYSPLAMSSSVEEVEIDANIVKANTPKEYCQQVWQWIAFAVFSGHPSIRNRIHTASLNVGSLRQSDVKLMQEVLAAVDPITNLLRQTGSRPTETISASKFMLSGPNFSEASAIVCESDSPLSGLAILERSEMWTSVFLPAWGEAWVHSNDIVGDESRVSVGPFTIRCVPRLKLVAMSAESMDASMELLQLVGLRLRHLTIKCNSRSRQVNLDLWCSRLFDACPTLESLEINSAQLSSLHFLVDGYESGKCRLARFKVTWLAHSVDNGLGRLVEALSTDRHPAAAFLSDLSLDPVDVAFLEDPVAAAALRVMLERNQRLRFFDIRFVGECELIEKCAKPFDAFDKQMISRARTPLDVRRRLAFLSVLSSSPAGHKSSKSGPQRACERLDPCVLANFFEMLPTRCERRVHLRPHYHWNLRM